VLEAGDAEQAIDHLRTHRDIELCLLDLSLRNGDGLGLLDEIRQFAPNTAVVIVSAAEDEQTIRRCIDAGAMSFIPKSAAPEVLTEALQRVLAGEIYLPEMEPADAESTPRPALTPRQRDVLKHLSQGLPTKLIARELGLSEYTIKEHIAAIFQALQVRNRTEAVIRASRLMLLRAS
jgi:DNA-binding NarL/FixJ family response regulator